MPHLVAAPDKFRGTASARDIAAGIARAASRAGSTCDQAPVADGGEGTLEALGGTVRYTSVQGPLGQPVRAEWRFSGRTAVVEMARASGLGLVGGPAGNDPLRASTYGTGQLIAAAVAAGARTVLVGLGGSATTDGGLGCLTALRPHGRLKGVELVVACDVQTRFLDAAEVFAPQKGATRAELALLRRRLDRLAQVYEQDYGVDVRDLEGSGAAGGLAGGLAALGARLVPGFDLVAEVLGLGERIAGADLVVTGEGLVDEQSFRGKVTGGVLRLAAAAGVPVLIVAGEVDGLVAREVAGNTAGDHAGNTAGDHAGNTAEDHAGNTAEESMGLAAGPAAGLGRAVVPGVAAVSLVERFGRARAMADPVACVEVVIAGHLEAATSTLAP